MWLLSFFFSVAQLGVKHCFVLSFFGGWGELKHNLFNGLRNYSNSESILEMVDVLKGILA